jgi:hypothetical protein
LVPAALFSRFDDQLLGAVTVDDLQRGGQDAVMGDLAARPVPQPWMARRAGGGVICSAPFLSAPDPILIFTVDLRC